MRPWFQSDFLNAQFRPATAQFWPPANCEVGSSPVIIGAWKAPGSPCMPRPISIMLGGSRSDGGWPGSEQTCEENFV